MQPITFVGLDVHKATIAVSVAEGGRDGEVRHLGRVENRPEVVRRLVERLRRGGQELRVCYEAGPCGYGLHRQLTDLRCPCVVVAPALIPRRPGDRVKTDRRDATALATLHRAGELTPVWVPDATHEAMRDLVRARAAAARALTKTRQQLQAFLLRHQRVHGGRAWTRAHRRWLADLRFDHPAQQIVLQDYISAVEDAAARVARLMRQIEELVPTWSMAAVVDALQAMRGVSLLAAVTLVAEVGDFTRFATPRQLMAYVGLVPSESSSGGRTRRGGITKAGNHHVRRVLIEGAWTYRFAARLSRGLHARNIEQPKEVRAIAWKAQLRLCGRYRRLAAGGKPKVVVTTAIAREMIGFIWAIAARVQPQPAA
jgi:transposase